MEALWPPKFPVPGIHLKLSNYQEVIPGLETIDEGGEMGLLPSERCYSGETSKCRAKI